MNTRSCTSILVTTLFALASTTSVFAQEQRQVAHRVAGKEVPAKRHRHYKLIDTGTLAGPNSSLGFEGERDINNNGTVVSLSDTAIPDPTCFSSDCLIGRAVTWKDGALTDLGALPPLNNSGPIWISDSGLVVGFSTNGLIDPLTGSPEFRAALFTDGKVVNLGDFGGNESTASGVNNQGLVVGCATTAMPDPLSGCLNTPQQSRAFLWKDGKMNDLGTLGGPDALAELVNNRGEVAGWSLIDSPIPIQHLFLWKNGKMRDLGNIGGTVGTVINGLNERGQIAGQMTVVGDQSSHPFLWDGNELRDLGTLGGDSGIAISLNESAEVIGAAQTKNNVAWHAFLWRAGRMHDLGTVGTDQQSFAYGINSEAQIVGETTDSSFSPLRAFIWERGSIADLNSLVPADPSVQLTAATGINEEGEIAVQGVLANGEMHAFVLIPCDDNHPYLEGCDYNLAEAGATDPVQGGKFPLMRSPSALPGVIQRLTQSTGLGSATWRADSGLLPTKSQGISAAAPRMRQVGDGITIQLTASPTTLTIGQSVALKAIVHSNGKSVIGATVTFSDETNALGTSVTTVSPPGEAGLEISTLSKGTHSITAAVGSDTSAAVTVTVNGVPSTTTLSASPATVVVGQLVTLTATVTGDQPRGAVSFSDGTSKIGAGTLSGGVASISVSSLSLGSHSITAAYAGDAGNSPSTSAEVSVVVNSSQSGGGGSTSPVELFALLLWLIRAFRRVPGKRPHQTATNSWPTMFALTNSR